MEGKFSQSAVSIHSKKIIYKNKKRVNKVLKFLKVSRIKVVIIKNKKKVPWESKKWEKIN